MVVDIQQVKLDGQHWVHISMDGEMRRRGPFADADEAEVMAVRLAAICRALNTEVHMQAAVTKGQQQRR
jgi:hypothetical protein